MASICLFMSYFILKLQASISLFPNFILKLYGINLYIREKSCNLLPMSCQRCKNLYMHKIFDFILIFDNIMIDLVNNICWQIIYYFFCIICTIYAYLYHFLFTVIMKISNASEMYLHFLSCISLVFKI